jgi:hypothetical protein
MCQISIGLLSGWWFFATPLKNDGVRQWGALFPTEWQKTVMFQTTNQIVLQRSTF